MLTVRKGTNGPVMDIAAVRTIGVMRHHNALDPSPLVTLAPPADQLLTAFDFVVDGLAVVRNDEVIVYVNRPLCVLFGYDPHELLGQRIDVLVPEARRVQHRRDCALFAAAGARRAMGRGDLDIEGRHRDGHGIPIDVQLAPLAGDMVAATVRDVTGQRQAAAERALGRIDLDVSKERLAGLLEVNELALQELFALAARLGAQVSRANGEARAHLSKAVATVDEVIERMRTARFDDGAGLGFDR